MSIWARLAKLQKNRAPQGEMGILRAILDSVERIEHFLFISKEPKSFEIVQGGEMANSITGIIAGAKGSFTGLPVPAGSVVTGTPTWASDNPLAVVATNTSDPSGLSIIVTVDPTATGSFNLSVHSTNPDGSVATGTASVPIHPAPPPPPVAVQSFDINQTA